jgi:hypothetical protein
MFFYLLWHHKHVSLQIKTGTYHPVVFNWPIFCLLLGLILTCIGTVLSVLIAIIDGLSFPLLGGLIPLSTGISFLIFYKLLPKEKN